MRTGKELVISLKHGSQKWDRIPFLSAVNMIENHTDIEHKSSDKFIKYAKEDQWIVGFWSELLGGAKAPEYSEWIAPATALTSARSAYNAKLDKVAIKHFNEGVALYNKVHRKWFLYRNAHIKGAERAITTMEVTNIVLGAAISGGAAVAGKSLLRGAIYSGALTAVDKTSSALGKYLYKAENHIDISQIVLESAASFVGSLIGGKLADLFIAKLSARIALGPFGKTLTYQQLQQWAKNTVLLPSASELQKFIIGGSFGIGSEILKSASLRTASAFKSKKVTMDLFVNDVVAQIPLSNQQIDKMRNEIIKKYGVTSRR
jgi:hypothetical protein